MKGRVSPVEFGDHWPRPLKFVLTLVVRTVLEMADDDATHMAAGVAYYALFSLFPLLLGTIAIIGIAADSDSVRREILIWTGSNFPGMGEFIAENVVGSARASGFLGVVSIVGFIWAGSAIFGAINRAVNRAWDVEQDRPFIRSKALQLGMALSMSILFALSFSAASVAQSAENYTHTNLPLLAEIHHTTGIAIFHVISFIFNLVIFLFLYKALPNAQTLWRHIWLGAVIAAILFEAAQAIFVFYLDNFATLSQVYGSIGSVIALLLWAYVSAFILILGAELSSEYGRMLQGEARGTPVPRRPDQGRFI